MAVGGWKPSETVRRYVDKPDAARNADAKLYDNGHDEPEPGALRVSIRSMAQSLSPAQWQVELRMARELGAGRAHSEVAAARAAIIEAWPSALDPPADCAREGCPVLVTVPNPRLHDLVLQRPVPPRRVSTP